MGGAAHHSASACVTDSGHGAPGRVAGFDEPPTHDGLSAPVARVSNTERGELKTLAELSTSSE